MVKLGMKAWDFLTDNERSFVKAGQSGRRIGSIDPHKKVNFPSDARILILWKIHGSVGELNIVPHCAIVRNHIMVTIPKTTRTYKRDAFIKALSAECTYERK